ncbi:Dipeptidyl-peptidase IV [Niastella koreensis GR20-10]|uniref:Dipeptidyl-peptidase IV n=1 Tax=Niastella koreensis (strain DSM 17620 / KACC 11465 / NBRC 106392 / GR20-10) TaxID=700598 RepID=G8TNL8_NIAKG|nr:Dipeptidyl-peptidase IV [Niastella koreensis GR20-10]
MALLTAFVPVILFAQGGIKWNRAGNGYYQLDKGELDLYTLPQQNKTVILSKTQLTPSGKTAPLNIQSFSFSADDKKVLLFTNTKKVWRLRTRGDYYVFDINTGALTKLGKDRPASSMMFAKFSPDGAKVAYVSEYNLYVEDLASGKVQQLTMDGNRKFINGTFDWVYEEEFSCRDGFRWSPDSKHIAYWQIDARKTKDYLMIDNTDSVYPFAVPVEYPIAGEAPSPFKIGVVDIASAKTQWMDIPTDPVLQSYVPCMEWAANNNELIVQHLNRHQNQSDLLLCNATTGASQVIYTEKDSAWIDILSQWDNEYIWGGWDWLNGGKEFMWASEKDGWRHLYRVSRDGKKEVKITNGDYDVIDISAIDEKNGYVYFLASPTNATQKYLYRTKLDGKGKAERVSPANQAGTHDYDLSPTALYARHVFSNMATPYTDEMISLPDHKGLNGQHVVDDAIAGAEKNTGIEFFKVKTEEGIEMDGWMTKPRNFDPNKKYPVVFYVYTEPAGQNVRDQYQAANPWLYKGDMAADGYIYISIDNRGTPVPKGRSWRKAIYRNIGRINIRDQAMAAKEVLKWPFIDASRTAVWGWSGGGSATLNLMFQFPEIYKTGIAVAAVGSIFTYDNIYQERYMGLPQENAADYTAGSAITYAKNLKGNLLYIHGSGDDNVHYQNAELLLNELIKYNRQFQFMSYPNRTHSISEGAGTWEHLSTLYTNYLRAHCEPGGK